jgi:hypothetical protein
VTSLALVTCRELPGLDADDQPLRPALAALGVDAEPAVWDDPGLDRGRFAAVLAGLATGNRQEH